VHYLADVLVNTRGIPRALEAKHEIRVKRTSITKGIHTALPSMSGSFEQSKYTLYPWFYIRERLYSATCNTKNTPNERIVHLGIIISV